ncbi:MAG: response regulator receiver modulated diguanylate cyclase [uncultured bacterium]|nr:MAG: response regulator receiver modulated diguanylate cyclase [uncultured bacterium]
MKNNKPLILIVDDNPQNLKVLGNMLTEQDYDIGVAQSGMAALEFVKTAIPDLILLDVMMPEMDGYETCKKVKLHHALKSVPIIFLTAKTDSEDIIKGFEAGGIDYVTKPFKSVELLARVKTHVEMKLLKGILPICCICGLIRDDTGVPHGKGEWMKVDKYIINKTNVAVSHSLCPNCLEKEMKKIE